MKKRITNSSLIFILAAASGIFFASCSGVEMKSTRSLLSTAGFEAHTPQTKEQQKIYAALPSNKFERTTVKGKVVYVFKDETSGVVYVGTEYDHRHYEKLRHQKNVEAEEEMNPSLATKWANQWGGHPG